MDNNMPGSVTGGSAIDETAHPISSDKFDGTAVSNRLVQRLGIGTNTIRCRGGGRSFSE